MDFKSKDFKPNISPIDVIKKGAFGGTYFRNIYSNVNNKFYKNTWIEFKELKDIDKKYYCSDFYDVNLNYCKVKVGTSLRFWEKQRMDKCNRSLCLVSMVF